MQPKITSYVKHALKTILFCLKVVLNGFYAW